jgi:hypothetical protein
MHLHPPPSFNPSACHIWLCSVTLRMSRVNSNTYWLLMGDPRQLHHNLRVAGRLGSCVPLGPGNDVTFIFIILSLKIVILIDNIHGYPRLTNH